MSQTALNAINARAAYATLSRWGKARLFINAFGQAFFFIAGILCPGFWLIGAPVKVALGLAWFAGVAFTLFCWDQVR